MEKNCSSTAQEQSVQIYQQNIQVYRCRYIVTMPYIFFHVNFIKTFLNTQKAGHELLGHHITHHIDSFQ